MRSARWAALAGVAAAVLWTVGVAVLEGGGNPADPERAEELAAHFRDNRTAILAAGLLHVLGGFAFLLFVGGLHAALRPVDEGRQWLRSATLVAGSAAGALMLALTGPQTTGATTDEELISPEAAVAFWRLAHVFFVGAEVAFAAFLLAVGLLALGGVLLPRWLGWFGIATAVLLLVLPIGWAALLLLVPIWLIAASVVLARRPVGSGAEPLQPAGGP